MLSQLDLKNAFKLAMLTSSMALVACAPMKFDPADPLVSDEILQSVEISSNFFKIAESTTTAEQAVLDQNQTQVSFQVQTGPDSFLNNLTESDFIITENGTPVNGFTLSANAQNIVKPVDIVFAVDVTGSMTSTIESAKTRLINFVNNTRASGFRTRMCLVTFGDYTVQKCDKFYDNNPQDPATTTQVTELISEITKLRAGTGLQDPGGYDLNENPMRALIDSASAPWANDSQRFLILITDDGFLYSPDNQGEVGAVAPRWNEVMSAIDSSKMSVFVAAPDLPGYQRRFQGQDSIVTRSGGEFFLFDDLISSKITLDTILGRIISRIKTTYTLSYVADEISGLDPSLPLTERNIQITLRSGVTGSIVSTTHQSNLPTGRESYKKRWKIDDKRIQDQSIKVFVNDTQVRDGFEIVNNEVVFKHPPKKGAKIKITYERYELKDSVQISPIIVNKNENLNSLSVFFNGKKANRKHVHIELTLENHYSIAPNESALSENDPFEIRKNRGLEIKIYRAEPQSSSGSEQR